MDETYISPSVCYKVEKIIGISIGQENCRCYKVQWAPCWISESNLMGCEKLIEQYLCAENVDIGQSNTKELSTIDECYEHGVLGTNKCVTRSASTDQGISGEQDMLDCCFTVKVERVERSSDVEHNKSNDDQLPLKEHITELPNEGDTHTQKDSVISNVTSNLHKINKTSSRVHTYVYKDSGSVENSLSASSGPSNESGNCSASSSRIFHDKENSLDVSTARVIKIENNVELERDTMEMKDSVYERSCSMIDVAMYRRSNEIEEYNAPNKSEIKPLTSEDTKKSFQCNMCSKTFSYRRNLKQHWKIHSDVRPHCCDLCHKRFKENRTLKIHMMRHAGEKHFQCAECLKMFLTKSELNRHLRVHSEERPYGCHCCSKKFKNNHDLQRHLKVHFEFTK